MGNLIFTGWRGLYEPQLGGSTPSGAISTRGTTVFIPGLLKVSLYGRIFDLGMGSYLLRMAMALRTAGRGFHTMRGGIDPDDHRSRPRFVGVVDVWKDFRSGDGTITRALGAGSTNPRLGFLHRAGRY